MVTFSFTFSFSSEFAETLLVRVTSSEDESALLLLLLLIELFFKPISFLTGDLFLSFKDTFLATEGFSDDDSTLL